MPKEEIGEEGAHTMAWSPSQYVLICKIKRSGCVIVRNDDKHLNELRLERNLEYRGLLREGNGGMELQARVYHPPWLPSSLPLLIELYRDPINSGLTRWRMTV